MWEYEAISVWLGKTLPWLVPFSAVVAAVGYHYGWYRGYDEGEKAMSEAIKPPQRQDYLDTV